MLSVMLLFLALFISQELVIDFMKPLLWHFSIWLVFVADNAQGGGDYGLAKTKQKVIVVGAV